MRSTAVALAILCIASRSDAQTCYTATSGGTEVRTNAFTAQTGSFVAQVDVTPSNAALDGGVGVSQGVQSYFGSMHSVVLFQPNGQVRVRNGSGGYAADTVFTYQGGVSYRVRMSFNVPAKTYTVDITPPGGATVRLATNYAFRLNTITQLNNWAVRAADAPGSVTACGFTLNPTTGDTTSPTVALGATPTGTVAGTITLSATASDNVGVVGVRFLVDGTAIGSEDLSSPYSVTYNTALLSNGSHTIAARARDAAGNIATTAARTLTFRNEKTAPTVSITAPSPGATVAGS